MNLFLIDYKRLVVLLVPTFLRKPRLLALLLGLTATVSKVYGDFYINRNGNRRRVRYNGQVCYLQALLNDELDRDERRISIADSSENTWIMVYDETKEEQLVVYDESDGNTWVMLYDEDAIRKNTGIFQVAVPWNAFDTDKNNKLRNYLNDYKLTGCRYKILNQN